MFEHERLLESQRAIDADQFKKASEILEELIKKNSPEAMYLRAQFGLLDEDVKWFETRHIALLSKAAALGHPAAMYQLSVYFEEGDFIAKDTVQALFFLQSAANSGYPNAIWRIGIMILYGTKGFAQDVQEGLSLIEKAAAAKSQGALRTLADFYANGKFGYPINQSEANRLIQAAEADDVIQI